MHARTRAGAIVVVLAAVLAGCTSSPDGTVNATITPSPDEATGEGAPRGDELEGSGVPLEPGAAMLGLPDSLDAKDAEGMALGVAWTSDPSYVYVIVSGPSSCPVLTEGAATLSDDEKSVVVETHTSPAESCTKDLVPATTVVALPDDIDTSSGLHITVGSLGSLVLQPYDPAGSGDAVWIH